MKFIPMNDHIEVEPLNVESVVASQETSYEEKGRVLSLPRGGANVLVGDIVYFDSWLIARYPDSEGKERYLVPFNAIRARETEEIQPRPIDWTSKPTYHNTNP